MTEPDQPTAEAIRLLLRNAEAVVTHMLTDAVADVGLADQIDAAVAETSRRWSDDAIAALWAARDGGPIRGGTTADGLPPVPVIVAAQIVLRRAAWCSHMSTPRPGFYFAAGRVLLCAQCVPSWRASVDVDAYLASTDCDICGGAASQFWPTSVRYGPILLSLEVGDCCHPLLRAPDRIAASRLRRNDRCPCGSGRKVKHCHGIGGPIVKVDPSS